MYANEQHRCGFRLRRDSTVMLTCKLLPKLCLLNLFFFRTKGERSASASAPRTFAWVRAVRRNPEPPQPTGLYGIVEMLLGIVKCTGSIGEHYGEFASKSIMLKLGMCHLLQTQHEEFYDYKRHL